LKPNGSDSKGRSSHLVAHDGEGPDFAKHIPSGAYVAELQGLPLFEALVEKRAEVTNTSTPTEKINLFLDLFTGRRDVYAIHWEAYNGDYERFFFRCANFRRPGCQKLIPGGKCDGCSKRAYQPFDGTVVRNHLRGTEKDESSPEFVAASYSTLESGACRFITISFESPEYTADASAFRTACMELAIPMSLERMRSGRGCRAWVFFTSAVPVFHARRLAMAAVTRAMDLRPDIGFGTYDGVTPNQDRVSARNLGSAVDLPLQQRERSGGNSVFVDDDWHPYADQWNFLSNIARMSPPDAERLSRRLAVSEAVFGVPAVPKLEGVDGPWKDGLSRPITPPETVGLAGRMIHVKLADQVYIERTGLPPAAVAQFARIGAFQNPMFDDAQKLGRWAGKVARVISTAQLDTKHVKLPRGCLGEVLQLAKLYDADVTFTDDRYDGVPLPEGVRFKGQLDARQKLAFESIMSYDIGIIKAVPGFGKTVLSIAAIAERRRNALIIVFTKMVFYQWKERLKNFLDIDPALIGWIGDGKMQATGVIDVALIQSLKSDKNSDEAQRVTEYVKSIANNYGHILIDEVHHIAAETFEPVARQARARYFLGASATPRRKDGRHPVIFMNFGPIRYQVDSKQSIAESGMAHLYKVKRTGFRLSRELVEAMRETEVSHHEVYKEMAEDEDRNNMILNDVLRSMDRGRSPIVLTNRRDHIDCLYELFRKQTQNVVVLRGSMTTREKRAAEELMALPAEENRMILATSQFLGEGFDDARLDALFMALPTVWEGSLEQQAGRLQRKYVGKSSVEITDYLDDDDALFRKAVTRTDFFRSNGFTIIDEDQGSLAYQD
jgi:superfamily II DNA or RNA helicase